MTTPSDTQSLILSRAASRPGNLALPLPEGLVGAAAKMVVGKMIARGWLEEVEANLRRGEPMWRETGDGHGTTLIATEIGLEAIGIEPLAASAVASTRKANPEPTQTRDDSAKPVYLHGISHFCLDVTDVREIHARLKVAGMRFHSDPVDKEGVRTVYGRDPFGNAIELQEIIDFDPTEGSDF